VDPVNEKIRDYIVATWLSGDSRGFDDESDLQESGILDSFSTLALIAFLDEAFRIQLEPVEVNAGTFRSVSTIAKLVRAKAALPPPVQ